MNYDPNEAPPRNAGIFGLPFTPEQSAIVLVPVPWDATTSYRPGTAKGPEAIHAASHQLDLFDVDLGEPWRAGIAMTEPVAEAASLAASARVQAEKVIALGGRIGGDATLEAALRSVNEACDRVQTAVWRETDRWATKGKVVGIVGGDHSVPFGAIRRIAEGEKEIGILHLDAHADLRDAYEGFTWSHASIMHNVLARIPQVKKLVQVGIRDLAKSEFDVIEGSGGRVRTFFDARLGERKAAGERWTAIAEEIIAELPPKVWLSFDIDGLDPSFCPHTGTPVPGGLSYREACILLKKTVESGRRVVGFDLNEVAPGPSGDEWDANVGARLLYQMCGWTLKSRT